MRAGSQRSTEPIGQGASPGGTWARKADGHVKPRKVDSKQTVARSVKDKTLKLREESEDSSETVRWNRRSQDTKRRPCKGEGRGSGRSEFGTSCHE